MRLISFGGCELQRGGITVSIELLFGVLGFPRTPVDTGSLDQWPSVERRIDLTLPDDFKQYINTFGTGHLAGFIYPLNPFSTKKHLKLDDRSQILLTALREIREIDPEECPYPIYPEKHGLFPWAITDNGDVLYWYTTGEPQDWMIVVNESRGPEYEKFAMSTTTFLGGILLGNVKSDILSDCLDQSVLFVPLL